VLYPVLPDLVDLERQTNRLLLGRQRVGGVYKPDVFAILASGCQLSDLPERDRELTSWVYGAVPSSGHFRYFRWS